MDIPDFRKGVLIQIAAAVGTPEDAKALRDRRATDLPFDEAFLKPIQARLNATLEECNVRTGVTP